MKKKFIICFIFILIIISCKKNSDILNGNEKTLMVKSDTFNNNEQIPVNYTCDGDNISPSISWTEGPENTKSYVLIADDPDAPTPGKIPIVHWILYNIPPDIKSISENLPEISEINNGIMQGLSYSRKNVYKGPCPPFGEHRYFFKIYAIDTILELDPKKTTKKRILKEINGHILAYGEIYGIYKRVK